MLALAVALAAPRAPPPLMRIQVVTDIDDTIKSSGGVALAGIPLGGVDTSFERGAPYPGVFQFAAELSLQSTKAPENVAVLTARAREFRFALELKQTDKICVGFRRAGEASGVAEWGVGPVLYGSVAEWVCQERKGWRKFDNFKRLHAQNSAADRRLRYVFIGDNGSSEKDLEAAQMIADAFPLALEGIFLHAVSPDEQPAPLPADTSYGGVPIRYFRTYATAATKAARLGLLGPPAVRRVLEAVEADMRADRTNVAPGSPNEALLLAELADARASGLGAVTARATGTFAAIARPLRPMRRLRMLRGAGAKKSPPAEKLSREAARGRGPPWAT